MATVKNDPRTIKGWVWYDWANSAFSLTIATVIFPIYYESLTRSLSVQQGLAHHDQYPIHILGGTFLNTSVYTFAVSTGFLLVALMSPLLSGIADFGGIKRKMMQFFVFLGSFSCLGMFFFTSETLILSMLLFVLSIVGFAGSLVFYNAFLPEIATEDQYDAISAKGFSYGYIGSVILLVINLLTILKLEWFFPIQEKTQVLINSGLNAETALKEAKGYYEGLASRLSFVSVGLWWLGFSQITFRRLPKETPSAGNMPRNHMISHGYKELKRVFSELKRMPELYRYLAAYLFMSMGVQTIMYVATLFGSNELKMSTDKLIATLLLIQLIAGPGAHLFSRLSTKNGNIRVLQITTFLWMGVCVAAYFTHSEYEFYIIAASVGLVMGGTQSLLRSTYAKLIPDETLNHASFFSFFDVVEKIAIVFGTFVFAFINELTGSMRISALSLGGYFLVCLLILSGIRNFKIHKG